MEDVVRLAAVENDVGVKALIELLVAKTAVANINPKRCIVDVDR